MKPRPMTHEEKNQILNFAKAISQRALQSGAIRGAKDTKTKRYRCQVCGQCFDSPYFKKTCDRKCTNQLTTVLTKATQFKKVNKCQAITK